MNLGKRFLEFLDRRVEGFGGAQYKTFGIFGVINYPLGYFILIFLGGDESILARLSAMLMSFPLVFVQHWPAQLKRYLNLYWFITLLYCLPIFTTYTLLRNHLSNEWLLNFSIGLFILFLIVDYILLIILYVLGVFLGFLLFILTGQEVVFQQGFPTNFIYIYGAMLIIGCIFARNKERRENEKLQTIKAVAGAIAHEMRTPLFSINTTAHSLKNYLPTLIKAYNEVKESSPDIESISPRHLEFINEIPDSIAETTQSAFAVIDMLLVNLKENPLEGNLETCSMQACIESALKTFPLLGEEIELISIDTTNNFQFKGSQNLIIHVLFNLLKNALYYVKSSGKGEIYLWMEQGAKKNKFYFKDTGAGISKEKLPYIFDRFYSQTKYGTGIGLSFCRLVMRGIGGDITCDSVEGEYTQFTLSFPTIKKDEEKK